MVQAILGIFLQENTGQLVVQKIGQPCIRKRGVGRQTTSPTQGPSARPGILVDGIRSGRFPKRLRPACLLIDTLQTDKFQLLSGPNIEHALAAVPVAGKYHRVSFCDVQHAVGGKSSLDV